MLPFNKNHQRIAVRIEQHVKKGEPLVTSKHRNHPQWHASTSGRIVGIERHIIAHQLHSHCECIVLEADGQHQPMAALAPINLDDLNIKQCIDHLHRLGVLGLSGSAFPTAQKFTGMQRSSHLTLIVNAAECEPYISCDDRLMRERASGILLGIQNTLTILDKSPHHESAQCIIGIEDNKPEAYAALKAQCQDQERIQVIRIPSYYPAGGARQLIKTLTGIQINQGTHAIHQGILCLNVGTIHQIGQSIQHNQPLVSRITTVTGESIANPGNFEVPIGMTIASLLERTGNPNAMQQQLSIGGPMMGVLLQDALAPITAHTNCIFSQEPPPQLDELACIRCGECTQVCPVDLMPQELFWLSHSNQHEQAQKNGLNACIECGNCQFVCPSHIRLVDYFRRSKKQLRQDSNKQQKADIARQRHEFRNQRLERLQKERAEKLARHKKAIQSKAKDGSSPAQRDKNAEIQAAIARSQARKAQLQKDKNTKGAST